MIKSVESNTTGQICQNLIHTCKRDILRRRFIVRWGLLLFFIILFVHFMGKSVIRFEIDYGDSLQKKNPESKRSADDSSEGWEKVVFNPREREAQKEMLDNLAGVLPQKKDNAVRQEVARDQQNLIHAFTGKTNLPPIYLDYVDLNQPWDKKLEVST